MSIVLENVSYTYAPKTVFEHTALRDISLSINDGEFVGIMGKTGCGKSTLLKIIDGLVKPTQGNVYINEQDIHSKFCNKSRVREEIGVIFQHPEYQLFESSVEKETAFGLKHMKISKAQKNELVRQALTAVGFAYDKVRDKSPFGLSGGEKRRLAIAGVLACKPKILILDEPIAGLDPPGRKEFLNLIQSLNDGGTTIIMISHNADAIAEYADRVIVLDNGQIIADDTAKAVFNNTELINKKHLRKPQVSEIASQLNERGINIPTDIIRYDELKNFLIQGSNEGFTNPL